MMYDESIVTDKMKEAGDQIASDLMDAQIAKALGGLGGSKDWEIFKEQHNTENMDLIEKYLNEEIDSVTAIYLAMHRVKENVVK